MTDHLHLATALARRFCGRGPELDDLVQVARLGLVAAAERYDPERGAFAAFASATILGELKRYFRDASWMVRPPRWLQDLQASIRRADADAPRELCDDELAEVLGEDVSHVREARRANGCFQAASLDRLIELRHRMIADPRDAYAAADDRLDLREAIAQLPENDRELLRMRFIEELSQQKIADRLLVSQMQVSRRLRAVLDELRRQLDREHVDVTAQPA